MNLGTASATGTYTAAIVTYRRPSTLETVLSGLLKQSVTPTLTIVADNDPDQSAKDVVEKFQSLWPSELVYSPVGENLGPAGGWAHAVSLAGPQTGRRGEWVLIVDDDDPIEAPILVERLLAEALQHGPQVAGIGLRGSVWDRRQARLRRLNVPEDGVTEAHYLASGGAPLYSWKAIDRVGFFKSELFFGFEDLDYGFRLRHMGYRLLTCPKPSLHQVADTGGVRTSWREYYKARALLWILREHVGIYAVVVTLTRSTLLGGLRLLILERKPSLLNARLLGAWDGLRGRLGVRRYFPGSNPPKQI